MTFRRATQDDVKTLQNLSEELFIDNAQYEDDLVMDWSQSEKGQKYFSEIVANPEGFVLIAVEDGKDVGYVASCHKKLDYRKSKYLEIENINVSPAYQSKGIGKQLVQKCVEWAKENGFQKLYVNSYFHNVRAIAFYKNCGFSEIDLSLEMKI